MKLLTPPIIPFIYFSLRRAIVKSLPIDLRNKLRERFVLESEKRLPFSGSSALFVTSLNGVTKYAEYGSGHSTRWLLKNSDVEIFTVDTSKDWLDTIDRENQFHDRLYKCHIDIGPLMSWGYPKNLSVRHLFSQYWEGPWRAKEDYDVVLIDGRFRIQCFLFSILRAKNNTIILFDDYCDRDYYHVVEEIIKPVETDGRMAKFIKTPDLDSESIVNMINDFKYYVE